MQEPNTCVSKQQQHLIIIVVVGGDGKEYFVGSGIESYWNLLNGIL